MSDEFAKFDTTPAEFRREEYLRRLDAIAGILGPDWCEGLDTVDWVRRQRE